MSVLSMDPLTFSLLCQEPIFFFLPFVVSLRMPIFFRLCRDLYSSFFLFTLSFLVVWFQSCFISVLLYYRSPFCSLTFGVHLILLFESLLQSVLSSTSLITIRFLDPLSQVYLG
ncbi:MAG: hypothetical protein J3Q66DRAFT_180551 [Benniella sp.]|nr:MAG: hypothetical protein J3Q66DRAFT_180551 [Benniella sp.]